MMSGTDLLANNDLSPENKEKSYSTVLKTFDLESLSAEERLSKLLTIPAHELVTKIPRSVALGPILDEETNKINRSFKDIATASPPYPAGKSIESIMIGDCAFDGTIMALRLGMRKAGIASSFTSTMSKALGSETSEKLFSVYNNLSSSTPDDQAFISVLRFVNDILWFAPTLVYAQGWSKSHPVYVYRFNEGNPWHSQWKGEANHILDVSFLFQNFNEYLSSEQQAGADAFAEVFLRYVAGEKPWKAWEAGSESTAMVFADGKAEEKKDVPEEVGRRGGFVKVADEVGVDTLVKAYHAFLSQPPPSK